MARGDLQVYGKLLNKKTRISINVLILHVDLEYALSYLLFISWWSPQAERFGDLSSSSIKEDLAVSVQKDCHTIIHDTRN